MPARHSHMLGAQDGGRIPEDTKVFPYLPFTRLASLHACSSLYVCVSALLIVASNNFT